MDRFLNIAIYVLVFGIATMVALAVTRGVEAMWSVRRRLGSDAANLQRANTPLLRASTVDNPFLLWVQKATGVNDSADGQKLKRDLRAAGFEQISAPAMYISTRFALAIGLPLLFLLSQGFVRKPIIGFPLVMLALGACALGLIAPRAFIDNRANARREQLEHEFPDALDLMVVCVEAGLGLEAAFVRVGQDAAESHPRITEEFNRLSDELRAGRSRAEALRSLADRTEVDVIRSFTALLIQTDSLGTSIGQTLRSYASEMRDHRFLKAEEKAMRIPVLLTIPLVTCILPVIMTAVMLPPIIDVIRTLLPALAGHHHHH